MFEQAFKNVDHVFWKAIAALDKESAEVLGNIRSLL
jgi:hypothetical protein